MPKELSPSMKRAQWLESASIALNKRFKEKGFEVPANERVSFGLPKSSGGARKHTIGQCWDYIATTDKHFEIFISPELNSGRKILGVLAHEKAHAVAGIAAGHKAPFKRVAEAVGLTGKMTATDETAEFIEWADKLMEKIGPYPAGALRLDIGRKKQSTRLLKCECADCGYVARVTRKWVEASGTPVCPADNVSMICEDIDGEDSE